MAAIDALKAIITFGNSNDFEDQEALEDLCNNFKEFVTSGDPEVQTLLPKIISKISDVLKDFESHGDQNSNETNSNETNSTENQTSQESQDFNIDKWIIETANRFVVD